MSPVSLSPNSDFNFFFGRYYQIGKFIIALPGICAACFFINAFHHKNLLRFLVLSFYRRFSGKTNVPIAVLSEYTEKEYEPFDSYSRFCPAMPVSVCFSDTALYTLSKTHRAVFACLFGFGPPGFGSAFRKAAFLCGAVRITALFRPSSSRCSASRRACRTSPPAMCSRCKCA